MGRAYTIQCKACGTQFIQSSDSNFGVMPRCIGCGEDHSEGDRVIRCPGCQQRVNRSEEEFRLQVIEEIVWE